MPSREATTHWQGDLQTGNGTVTLDSSNAGSFPVSFPSRAADAAGGLTSPEELIAAAHSACYAMSLSNGLTQGGNPPETLDVSAHVTLGRGDSGLAITSIVLTVEGTVPGIDDAAFQAAAETAKSGCIVSRALAAVPSITLEARLRP
jgi:osmotically inducible protein OsmC